MLNNCLKVIKVAFIMCNINKESRCYWITHFINKYYLMVCLKPAFKGPGWKIDPDICYMNESLHIHNFNWFEEMMSIENNIIITKRIYCFIPLRHGLFCLSCIHEVSIKIHENKWSSRYDLFISKELNILLLSHCYQLPITFISVLPV